MSKISKKYPDRTSQDFGDHKKYLTRITKTLCYGKLPKTDSLSLPVTELAAELFSEAQKGKSIARLHYNDAARISRNACISPCSLVIAMLYLERLKKCNPDYLERTTPSDLFLVSLMISCKFLFDDGEADQVYIDEWAASGGISVEYLVNLERDFLNAIEWKVFVNNVSFWNKLQEVETTIAQKQGSIRGFFTYTELQNVCQLVEVYNLIQCLATISAILIATYTAGLLTLFGSVFLTTYIPGTSLYTGKIETPIIKSIQIDINETKTDLCRLRNIDAVDVLKTGIFLASIKSLRSNCDNETEICDNNIQNVSWDWWNVPTMNWLSKTSDFITVPVNYYVDYYFEKSAINMKQYQLVDQMNKATKTRIQDQLETSWHKEWIDTIKCGFFYNKIIPHILYNVKS